MSSRSTSKTQNNSYSEEDKDQETKQEIQSVFFESVGTGTLLDDCNNISSNDKLIDDLAA